MNNNFDQQYMTHSIDTSSDDIQIGEYVRILIERKKIIGIIASVFLFVGGIVAFFSMPVYSVDVLLQVEGKQSPMGLDVMSGLSGLGGGEGNVTSELEILKSRSVGLKVIEKLSLRVEITPKYFPLVGAKMAKGFMERGKVKDAFLGLSSYAWGGENIKVEQLKVPDEMIGETLMLVAGGAGQYRILYSNGDRFLEGKVGHLLDNGKGFVLYLSKLDARQGTEFSLKYHSIGSALNRLNMDFGVSEKGNGSGILSLKFQGTDKYEITKKLNTLADEFVKLTTKKGSEEAERSLAFLETRLPELKENVEVSARAYQKFRIENNSVNLEFETRSVLQNITLLKQELLKTQQERDGYRQRFKDNHPVIIGLDTKIKSIHSARKKLNVDTLKLPRTQRAVLRLEQDLQLNTLLYNKLLTKTQELRLAKAGAVGNVRIIDYAIVPDWPIKPNKSIILSFALVGGLLFGSIYVLFKGLVKKGVDDQVEIEAALNIPVLASIPLSQSFKASNEGLFLLSHANDPSIDELQNLRASLHFSLLNAANNIIMITGVSSAVETNFISSNLAGLLASGEKTAILIDADIRQGNLHHTFGVSCQGGFVEFISEDLNINDLIHTTQIKGLSFMSAGVSSEDASNVLLKGNFAEKLLMLSETFDYVVIVAASVNSIPDAAIIGRCAGTSICIAKSNHHPLSQLQKTVNRLLSAGVHLNGFILNEIES